MFHLVMDIGCLECGIPSDLVGCFNSKEAAKAIATALDKQSGSDHSFEVFSIPGTLHVGVVIEPEYVQQVDATGVAYREF